MSWLSVPTVTVLAYEEYQENGNTYIFGEITEDIIWTEENLRKAGVKGEKIKETIDQEAARIILQDYLNRE